MRIAHAEAERHVLAVTVDNEAGILAKIAGLFTAGIVALTAQSLPFGPTLFARYPLADARDVVVTPPDSRGGRGIDMQVTDQLDDDRFDPDKKKKYDQFGLDPDARFDPRAAAGANGGASPFGNGFARRGPPGFGEEEMTPEELFRQFFGGAFGGPFGMFSQPPRGISSREIQS